MKLDKRSTMVIGVAVIFAILIAGWFLVVSPAMSKQAELNSDLQAKQEQIDAAKTKLQALQQVKANIGEYKKQNDELTAKFPGNADIKLLLSDITSAGKKSGIKQITQIESGQPQVVASDSNSAAGSTNSDAAPSATADPSASTSAGSGSGAAATNNLAVMPLKITASGSQGSLKTYTSELSKMKRAFLISQAGITCERGAKTCDLTVEGSTYLYRQTEFPGGN